MKRSIVIIWAIFCLVATGFSQQASSNRVVSTVPQVPIGNLDTLSPSSQWKKVLYSDGLGRPLQEIQMAHSPTHSDLIQIHAYDDQGRNATQFLPFTRFNNQGDKVNQPFQALESFYLSTAKVANTHSPWQQTKFDQSPLSRPVEQGSPGDVFQLDSGHTRSIRYLTNTVAHPVRNWTWNGSGATSNAIYAVNLLHGSHSKDEDGASMYEFKDRLGRLVYRKVLSTDLSGQKNAGGGTSEWHETYWVYDDFGHLMAVIPPLALQQMANTNLYDTQALGADLIFQYRYDERHRVVEKKVPGKDWVFLVYDNLDRPILSQDGNLRANQEWLFTKFDHLGRPILTGLFNQTSYTSRISMQSLVDGWQVQSPNHEKASNQQFATQHGYTQAAFPQPSHASGFYQILTVSWYDHYDFDQDGLPDVSWTSDPDGNLAPYTSTRILDKITGSMVRVLNTQDINAPAEWLETHFFYDDKGRISHTYANDHLNQVHLNYLTYDFVGRPVKNKSFHQWNSPEMIRVVRRQAYDHGGRLLRTWMQFNQDPEVLLAEFHYNEIGELIDKEVGKPSLVAPPLQSVDYHYHIRGWLAGINSVSMTGTGLEGLDQSGGNSSGNGGTGANPTDIDANDLFALELHFEAVDPGLLASPLYSGNVAGISWRSRSDDQIRAFGYGYDSRKRLTQAKYRAFDLNDSAWSAEADRYNMEEIGYDANGNILHLERNGFQASGQYGEVDHLNYLYQGNQLQAVTDLSPQQGLNDFQDQGATSSQDYAYDANGNLLSDANKGASMDYNYLDRVASVDLGAGQTIHYLYDATGRKLRKQVIGESQGGETVRTRDYWGPMVFQDGDLEFYATPEGRAVPVASGGNDFRYEYHFTDHLGNTRLTYSDLDGNGVIDPQNEILQENHYDPYGLDLKGIGTSISGVEELRKYNGVELQTDFDLNCYQMPFRMYDPQVGRWWGVDALAEQRNSFSSYNFNRGNPMLYADPSGLLDTTYHFDSQGTLTNITDLDEQGVNIELNMNVQGTQTRINKPWNLVVNDKIDKKKITSMKVGESIFIMTKNNAEYILERADAPTPNTLSWRHFIPHVDFVIGLRRLYIYSHTNYDYAHQHLMSSVSEYIKDAWKADKSNALFLMPDGQLFNIMDAGNWLFGATSKLEGVPLVLVQAGAHYDNLTENDRGGFDSYADQKAIIKGWRYSNLNWRDIRKTPNPIRASWYNK